MCSPEPVRARAERRRNCRPKDLAPRAPRAGRRLEVVKGALITVKCDCGELTHLAYGEQWACPTCGRRWNTAQIPADEYWGLMKQMRNARLNLIRAVGLTVVIFGVLSVTINLGFLLLFPIIISAWTLLYMPQWRRKLRLKARAAPTWTLRPE